MNIAASFRRLALPVLFILITTSLLSSCSILKKSPSGKIYLDPCTIGGIQARCGKLKVYENREAHTGRTIDLNVAVIPAKQASARADPLFYLAGGPGGGASQFIGTAASMFADINNTHDLVYMDQRGTGQSNLMICPEIKEGEDVQEVFRQCLVKLEADPQFYTTALGMDDLDDVRQALGYEKINLYGMSYGVYAAQVYLNRHPDHVRSVILDHGALLQHSFAENWASNSQRGLEKLFMRCQSDAGCSAAYPDISAEFEAIFQQTAQTVHTGIWDPETVQEVAFDRATFGSTIHYLLMEDVTAVQLPYLVHQAAGGDWSGLAKEYMNSKKAPARQLRRIVMTLEILCYEPWWGGSLESINRLGQGSYYLEASLADRQYMDAICPLLPDPGASAQHGPAQPSEAPILLFTGEIDPQDNLEGIAGYQELWPNSMLVVQPGVSHNFTPDTCWNSLMGTFIEQASVADLPLECVQEYQPPEFK